MFIKEQEQKPVSQTGRFRHGCLQSSFWYFDQTIHFSITLIKLLKYYAKHKTNTKLILLFL